MFSISSSLSPSPSPSPSPPRVSTPPDLGAHHFTDSPTQVDIHHDLFPDYYGGSASIPAEPPKDGSLENNVSNGSEVHAFPINDNKFPIPVQPGAGGEGLPYAPIDWPNPGDIWSWKVGKRVSNGGFFSDRFLIVPKSLRIPNYPKMFPSKPTVERFIRSQFPDADLEAFFASFIWRVPAVLETSTQGVGMADAENESGQNAVAANGRLRRTSRTPKTPQTSEASQVLVASHSSKKRGTPQSSNSRKKQRTTKEPTRPRQQTRQHLKDFTQAQPKAEDINGGLDMSFLDDEKTREEFDKYLSSLDDILAKPLNEEPIDLHAMPMRNSFLIEDEMFEARKKLSSLLDMDFPSLICFKDLDELTHLASRLRKDPTLTAEQLVKLKLIEEIPTFCEVFLENREIMEQADRFFTTLEVNKAKVTSLRQEYSDIKEQVTQLQSEVDSNLMTVSEIDNQITQLKSRRAELTRIIEKKKNNKDELTYNQKLVANSIPKVVHEIQLANARKPDWELKKDNAVRHEAEILAKFAPLKGFSL